LKAYNKQTAETVRIDLTTKNTSWLKMAVLLKSMKVENAYFFLAIRDKELIGVDPYDDDLDEDTKVRIWAECIHNRWYFYREVFRVSENGAATDVGGGSPFLLSRGSLAYLWAMEKNISTYLIMPRQTGKTWVAIADATWTHQFNRGSTILHFNKSQKDANDNLQRIKQAISMLPRYLQHSASYNLESSEKSLVKNNEKTIRNVLGATIEAMASAGNESKADAIARGKTASKIWYDEIAFIFFNEVIYTAATPAYEKATEAAKKHGAPYAISITTTPGDLATPHGAFAYKMMKDSIPFNESFYDMREKKLYDIIENTPDKIPFLFIQFSYLQLGETEEWYLSRYKKMNNPIRARREYLLEWMNSNGNSPFDPDDIELVGQLADQKDLTKETIRINKYFEMSVYGEYHGRKPVIIGVDVAGSLGRDASAVVVVHPETLHPIAIFKSNMIESSKLRKLLQTIVKKLYPNCILTIENNSVGKPLIDELRETPIARVLYKERKKRKLDQGATNATKKRTVESIEYGHNTNTTTRPQMMETLESIVHNSPAHVGYRELYEEIRFLELKNGRIDHSAATHDDVTMAYMGALWVIRYGTGLKGKGIYYNITDGQDDFDELQYDVMDSIRFANRLLKGTKDERKEAEDELIDYMMADHPVQTSNDLRSREREEYFKALGKVDGLNDDDEEEAFDSISDRTQALITQARRAFVRMDPYSDDDPIAAMLNPVHYMRDGYGGDDESWSDLYKW